MHLSLKAEELFSLGNYFTVTNTIITAIAAFLLLAIFLIIRTHRLALIPSFSQGITEVLFEGIMSVMDAVLLDRKKTLRYLPLVATIFLFVLTSNWLGILPGVGSIGVMRTPVHEEVVEVSELAVVGEESVVTVEEKEVEKEFVPLFRPAGSDLKFTLALAIIAVLGVNLLGVTAFGFFAHFGKFFTLKNPIYTFVGLLEFISEFAKIISFSFSLFGNVFAGEVLLTIIGFLVPVFIPLPFLFLEVFVGFIQAFVFSMLTLVFIAMATAEHSH